jgi:hypothetical protein
MGRCARLPFRGYVHFAIHHCPCFISVRVVLIVDRALILLILQYEQGRR